MPCLKQHCSISALRTGKSYRSLHKWMDLYFGELGVSHREKRHRLDDIAEVRRRWGAEGVEEFLIHIVADYQDTTSKLLEVLKTIRKEKKKLRKILTKYLSGLKVRS